MGQFWINLNVRLRILWTVPEQKYIRLLIYISSYRHGIYGGLFVAFEGIFVNRHVRTWQRLQGLICYTASAPIFPAFCEWYIPHIIRHKASPSASMVWSNITSVVYINETVACLWRKKGISKIISQYSCIPFALYYCSDMTLLQSFQLFHWKLNSHWLEILRQRHVAIAIHILVLWYQRCLCSVCSSPCFCVGQRRWCQEAWFIGFVWWVEVRLRVEYLIIGDDLSVHVYGDNI